MKVIFFILALSQIDFTAQAGSLSDQRRFWYEYVVEYCQGYPSKENCDDGDSVLFNGLLCAAGVQEGCDTVRDSQDVDGRWWRSPRRKGGNLGAPNSFSRDQGYGVLLYLAATSDRQAAQRWLQWIENNRACSVKNPFNPRVCSVKGPYRLCRDDENKQCTISPTFWSVMGRVWDHLHIGKKSEMRDYRGAENSEIEKTSASKVELGYRVHLKGVQVFLKKIVGQNIEGNDILSIIYNRQPYNPFFRYLKEGVSQDLVDQVLNLCPSEDDHLGFPRFQWAWERATSSEAWRESMGWDCIFISKLLENGI